MEIYYIQDDNAISQAVRLFLVQCGYRVSVFQLLPKQNKLSRMPVPHWRWRTEICPMEMGICCANGFALSGKNCRSFS